MAITVIMQDSRPDGAGGTYKKGSTYSLPDPLATYFLDIGLAKRTSARSEQTGATVSGDSAGRFPSAPSMDKSVPLTATLSDGGIKVADGFASIIKTDFKPSVVLTMSAAATYGQTGNTVTVSAAGHNGINRYSPTGLRVFWPGSAAIPAGWYDGYTYIDANSFSFTNPVSQTVSAGSAITGSVKNAYIAVAAFTLPIELAADGALLTHEIFASCDSTAAIKVFRTRVSGNQGGFYTVTGSPCFGKRDLSTLFSGGRWYSYQASDGSPASLLSTAAFPSGGLVELCAGSSADNVCMLIDSVKVRYVP